MSSLRKHFFLGFAVAAVVFFVQPLAVIPALFYSLLPDFVRVGWHRLTGNKIRISHYPFAAFVLSAPLLLVSYPCFTAGLIAYLLHLAEDGRCWDR